ncbi:hypothetical protein VCHC71A1_00572A, partial [Vibrio cholerae HC-71A1]
MVNFFVLEENICDIVHN